MRRITFLVMMIFVVASPARADNWAEQLFDELTVDFGTVPRGQILTHSFRLVNNTKKTVRIASVRASMSPITAQAMQTTLAPGEETAILVQMDTKRFLNQKTTTIFITFDQPGFKEVRLWVQANSRDDMLFAPAHLDFKKLKRDATSTAQMNISFLGKPKILLTQAKCECRFIKPKLQEVRREANRVEYQLSATFQGDIPEGIWNTEVWLTTNDAEIRKVRVPVSLIVEQSIVSVKISGPSEAFVDQPITFHVEVQNKGTIPTDKDLSLILGLETPTNILPGPANQIASPPRMDILFDLPIKPVRYKTCNGLREPPLEMPAWKRFLPMGLIPPGQTNKRSFTLTAKQAENIRLSVYKGMPSPESSKKASMVPPSNVATANVQVNYDPKAPVEGLLPKSPQRVTRNQGLPRTLAEVPEVFFQEPLTKDMLTQDAAIQTARTIDRINYLNGRKIDAFVMALVNKRPDLAGLSFLMGDACRMKKEDSLHFVAALEGIRELQQPRILPTRPLVLPASSLPEPNAKRNGFPQTTDVAESELIKKYRELPLIIATPFPRSVSDASPC